MPVASAPEPVGVEDVRDRVNADDDGPDGPLATVLARCLTLAEVKVAAHVADYAANVAMDPTVQPIPDVVMSEAVLSVAAELFTQQKAPNGVLNQQYAADDGGVTNVPIRISADPLRPAYPLLGQWVLPVTFA